MQHKRKDGRPSVSEVVLGAVAAGLEALALSCGEQARRTLAQLVCLGECAERKQIVERPSDRAGVRRVHVHPVVEDERKHFFSLRRARDRNTVRARQDDDAALRVTDEDVLPFVDDKELVPHCRIARFAESSQRQMAEHALAAGPEEQASGMRFQTKVEILGDDADHDTGPGLVAHEVRPVIAGQLLGLAGHHFAEHAGRQVFSAKTEQHPRVLVLVLRRGVAETQFRVSWPREHHSNPALRSTFRERVLVHVSGH